jgi:pilus assembly protein CpaE
MLNPDLAIVEVGDAAFGNFADLSERIAAVRKVFPDRPVIAVGGELATGDALELMRAGANDFLARDSDDEDLRAQVSLHLKDRKGPSQPSDDSHLTVILGGKSSEFENHVAVNYAVTIASRLASTGRETLLVDLALPSSEAMIALGLTVNYTVRDAFENLQRLDKTLITTALARHEPSGLYLLPLSIEAEDIGDLQQGDILDVIDMLRGMFHHVIVNSGYLRYAYGFLPSMLQDAETILVTVTQSFASIKACHDLLETRRITAQIDGRFHLVVAEYDQAIDLTDEQIREHLGIPQMWTLPRARAELINAGNNGTPLVLIRPESPYGRAIGQLVQGSTRGDSHLAGVWPNGGLLARIKALW